MATDILTQLANPETMKALTFSQKMQGGLLVTVFGMGITILALVVLQFVMGILAKFTVKAEKKHRAPIVTATTTGKAAQQPDKTKDEELIAVISAAIAAQMHKTTGEIRIRNIRKTEEPSPSWNRAGILEQMNTRL
jgi:sodium pump decarboxylase gamma subunit